MDSWWKSVKFGRQHTGEDPYAFVVTAQIVQFALNMGVFFGVLGWLVGETLSARVGGYRHSVRRGECRGRPGTGIGLAPGAVRVVVRRAAVDPHAVISAVRKTLERRGYEPVEVTDRLCKLDRNVGMNALSAGPLSLTPYTTYVVLAADSNVVTIAGPCEILPGIVDLASLPDDDSAEQR